jgi:hypothetical protein
MTRHRVHSFHFFTLRDFARKIDLLGIGQIDLLMYFTHSFAPVDIVSSFQASSDLQVH